MQYISIKILSNTSYRNIGKISYWCDISLLGFKISQVLVKEFIFHHLKNNGIENPFRGAGKDW